LLPLITVLYRKKVAFSGKSEALNYHIRRFFLINFAEKLDFSRRNEYSIRLSLKLQKIKFFVITVWK